MNDKERQEQLIEHNGHLLRNNEKLIGLSDVVDMHSDSIKRTLKEMNGVIEDSKSIQKEVSKLLWKLRKGE